MHNAVDEKTWLRLTELPRAVMDLSALMTSAPLLSSAPRGEGQPVLVLPGYYADDDSTWVLRRFLSQSGYDARPWGLGRNMGASRLGGYAPIAKAVLDLQGETGRKVSLVGWSLGGLHALAVAYHLESSIRQLITLGSPLADIAAGPHGHLALPVTESIPITTVYSRTDSVVPWQRSRIAAGPHRENIEVSCSHMGFNINPSVLYAVADRLSQPEGQFKPFQRRGLLGLIYPLTATTNPA